MSFSQELKDFVSGFQAGTKIENENAQTRRYDSLSDASETETKNKRDAGAQYAADKANATPAGPMPRPAAGDSGSSGGTSALPIMAQIDSDPNFQRYKSGISQVETGGREDPYSVIGPTTVRKDGTRDYPIGKYQIMASNVPSWSEAALGKRMTPEELKGNADAQEAIFKHQTVQNLKRFGSWEDAASVWHSGRPLSRAGGAADVLGTRTPDYVRKVLPADLRGKPGRSMFNPPATRVSALDTEDDEGLVPTTFAAEGGVIPEPPRRPEALGLRDYGTGNTEDAGSNPAVLDFREGRTPTGDDLGDGTGVSEGLLDIEGARKFAEIGLHHIQARFGLNQPRALPEADPQLAEAHKAFALGVGAARPEEVEAIKKTVDPNGQLTDDQRQIAAWNGQYKFWMDRGEPEKAARAADAMLMATKRAATTAGTIAYAAAEKGDLKGAGAALAHAYDQLPDGNKFVVGAADGKGLGFQIIDAQGRVTEKGKMTMDDMIHTATGLMNGTEWLQSILKFSIAAPSAAERKTEAERRSVEEFEATRKSPGEDFVSTLDDDERKKFLAMPLAAQKMYRKEHESRVKEEARQGRFDERMAVGAENMDRREALDLFKFGTRLGQWEETRNQVMTAQEKSLAQKQLEEEGRNNRWEGNQAARLRRQREIDERILKQRPEGGRRAAGGPRLTAKQSDAEAAARPYDAQIASIQGSNEVPAGTDEEGGPWTAPPVAAERTNAVNAERSYQSALEKTGANKDKNAADFGALSTAVDAEWLRTKGKGADPIPVGQKHLITNVAAHMARANLMSEEQAAAIALQAGAKDVPVQFVRDPADPRVTRVKVGNNPPVVIGSDALSQIATLRGGAIGTASTPVPDQRYTGTVTPRGVNAAVPQAPGRSGSTQGVPTGAFNPVEDAKRRATIAGNRTGAIRLRDLEGLQ